MALKIINDDEASLFMREIDTVEDPKKRDFMLSKLKDYRDERRQEEERRYPSEGVMDMAPSPTGFGGSPRRRIEQAQESRTRREDRARSQVPQAQRNAERLQSMFGDMDSYISGLEDTDQEFLKGILENSINPDADKKRWANIEFLAQRYGEDHETIANNYVAYRGDFSKNHLENGRRQMDDGEFYTHAGEMVEKERLNREWMQSFLVETQKTAMKGGGTQVEAYAQVMEKMREEEGFDPEMKDFYQDSFFEVFSEINQKYAPYQEQAKELFEFLGKRQGIEGIESELDLDQAVDILDSLDKEDRDTIYYLLQVHSDELNVDRNIFSKTADLLGRSIRTTAQGHGRNLREMSLSIAASLPGNDQPAFVPEDVPEEAMGSKENYAQWLIENWSDTGTDEKAGVNVFNLFRGNYREATEAERELLSEQAGKVRKRMDIVQELREIGEGVVDPIEGENPFTRKVWLPFIESAPFTAQFFLPVVGMGAVMSSTMDFRLSEIRKRTPDIDRNKAINMAMISAVVEVPSNYVQRNLLIGKAGVLNGLVAQKDGLSGVGKQIISNLGVQTVEQNLQEAFQDFAPIAIQQISSYFDEEIPGLNMEEVIREYGVERIDTFWAMIPMVLVGSGSATFRDYHASKELLGELQNLRLIGIKEEAARKIVTEPNAERKVELYKEAYAEKEKAISEEAQKEVAAESEAFEAYQDSETTPTVQSDGEGGFVVTMDGETVGETNSFDAAQQLSDQAVQQREDLNRESTNQMIEYIENFQEEGSSIERAPPKTLQDQIDEGSISEEEAYQAIQVAGMNYREDFSEMSPADMEILGENISDFRDNVFEDVSTIMEGADLFVPLEEHAEGYFKRIIAQGDVAMERAKEWKKSFEELTGEVTHGDSTREMTEWFSQRAVDYATGKNKGAPAFFREFLTKFLEYARHVMRRAAALMKLSREGKLDTDLESHLARAVGLERIPERKIRQGETVQDGESEVTFSMRERETQAKKDIDSLIDRWKQEGIDSWVSVSNGDITLSKIVISQEKRGLGTETEKMKELLSVAERHGMRVLLTPSTDFGATSKARLTRFYKGLGFVENKGKNKDYTTQETMIWTPESYQESGSTYAMRRKGSDKSPKATIRRVTGQTQQKVTMDSRVAMRRLYSAQERASKEAARVTKKEAQEGKYDKVTPEKTKETIRRMTGQASQKMTIDTRVALRRLFSAQQKAAKDAAKFTKEELAQIKKELAREVIGALPLSDRGKFALAIAKIENQKQLKKELERLEKEVLTVEKREAIKDLKDTAKRIPKKLRPEYKEKIDAVLEGIGLQKMTEKTKRQLNSMADFIEEHPENQIPPEVIAKLRRLDLTAIADFETEDIKHLSAMLKHWVGLNQLKNQIFTDRRKRTLEQFKGVALSEIVTNKELTDSIPTLQKAGKILGNDWKDLEKKDRTLAQKFFGEWSSRPEQMLREVSEQIRELIYERLGVDGYRRELSLRHTAEEELFDAMRDAGRPFGPKATRKQNRDFTQWVNEKFDVTLDGSTVKMRRNELVYLYQLSLDHDRNKRIQRDGIVLERLGRKKVFVPASEEIEAIPSIIGKDGMALVNAQRQTYNGELRDLLNKEWVDVHFFEIATAEDYTPSRTDPTRTSMNLAEMMDEHRLMSAEGRGMFKERDAKARAPLQVVDSMTIWSQHLDATAKTIAYLKPARDARTILNDTEIKRSIIDRFGDEFWRYIVEKVADQTVGIQKIKQTPLDTILRNFLQNAGVSILSLRITTPLINPSGLPISASYLNNPANIVPAATVYGNPAEWKRIEPLIRKHSPYFKERYDNFTQQVTSGVMGERAANYGAKPLAQYGLAGIQATDKLGAYARWKAAELDVEQSRKDLKKGSDEYFQEVADVWEKLMFRGENTSHPMEMSGLITAGRRNPWFAPWVMFQSSVSKIYTNSRRAVILAREGKYRESVMVSASVIASWMIASGVRRLVREALRPEDEEEERSFVGDLSREAIGQLPIIGQPAASVLMSIEAGTPIFKAGTVVDDFLTSGMYATAGAVHMIESIRTDAVTREGDPKWQEDAKKLADNVAEMVANVTGAPYSALSDWGKLITKLTGEKESGAEFMNNLLEERGFGGREPDEAKARTNHINRAYRAILEEDPARFQDAIFKLQEMGEEASIDVFYRSIQGRYRSLFRVLRNVPEDDMTELQRQRVETEKASFDRDVDVLYRLWETLPSRDTVTKN